MKGLGIHYIDRDQGEFKVVDDSCENVFWMCSLQGSPFVYVQMLFVEELGAVVVHLTHKIVGPRSVRAMRIVLSDYLKPYLRSRGIKLIIGMTDSTTKNWLKLMRLIGLSPFVMPNGKYAVKEEV